MSSHEHDHALQAVSFDQSYPLPLRILSLISLGALCWATNLHILSILGIDTSAVLDVRADLLPLGLQPLSSPISTQPFIHPSKLYRPVYTLSLCYFAWTATAWLLWTFCGDAFAAENSRYMPAAFALVGVMAVFLPAERLQKKERLMFLRSLKRILFDGLWSTVPFCDVILADILTSFAKVLGDVWICAGLLVGQDTRQRWGGHWGVPLLTSLPYLLRLRQCISEYVTTPPSHSYTDSPQIALTAAVTPSNPRTRSLCNALKYASAFPVILFSAMQTRSDLFDTSSEELAEAGVWLGPRSLFNLWILAVFVNSFYSFWWDVTNDWGLSLLLPKSWRATPAFVASHIRRMTTTSSPAVGNTNHSNAYYNQLHSRARSVTNGNGKAEELNLGSSASSSSSRASPPQLYTSSHYSVMHSCSNPLLRPSVILPDTLIYYSAIAIDLLLRFTWSLKLSTHLHAIHEIEQGVFLLEALEVLRRWMWVFIRVEWQAVAKGMSHAYDKISIDIPLQEQEGKP